MKMNKKGVLRIIEAFLAISIILGAILIFTARQAPQIDSKDEIYERQRQILEIINKNDTLREKVLLEDSTYITNEIKKRVPKSWKFTISICDINDICSYNRSYINTEIYSTETIITSTLIKYDPKKLRFFVWFE